MVSRRKLPSLNALRAFETAGRKLSFRAAADELGVTQGAIAQQVRALEDHLNVTLFQRLPRGLCLTPEGTKYLVDITRAFDILAESTESLFDQPDRVTISVTPTIATKMLIPRLGDLHAVLPEINLCTLATEVVSDFDRDLVDIAIRLTQKSFPENLETRLLFHQELIAVASPDFIQDLALPLQLEQLINMPLLHDAHDHWPNFLNTNAKLSGAVFNQTTLALDAALSGQGVALACQAFVDADIRSGKLVQVTSETKIVEPSYYLVRKKSSHPNSTVDKIWQWCIEYLGAKQK
ncbi:LysR substrate-binding domain-containing protein [Acinetobacter gyllenbergii]|uniref:LysR substrate-binding domain-containing protein n=1 Tax=Acinetobacter gyllenbergii TaxID=134534 RepID=UPI000806E28C|nr:LysR substrate-binding domain-containing protein [Acinetobacter gyllenbergii]OBY75106.1 LysR family transcriptional regulator [Acinetobacter gyllenbergii]